MRNVIWCTGYQHGFPWINLPIFGEDGEPIHEQGIVPNVPGMYFVGLHFLHAMSSATLIGVGRDAERIANAIASRTSAGQFECEGGRAGRWWPRVGLRPGCVRKRKPPHRSWKTDPAW